MATPGMRNTIDCVKRAADLIASWANTRYHADEDETWTRLGREVSSATIIDHTTSVISALYQMTLDGLGQHAAARTGITEIHHSS